MHPLNPQKIAAVILIAAVAIAVAYSAPAFIIRQHTQQKKYLQPTDQNTSRTVIDAFNLLKKRQDTAALSAFEHILSIEPNNTDALWGKAEVLRRRSNFKASEQILTRILKNDPRHIASRITLSYLFYNAGKFGPAIQLIQEVLNESRLDRENEALGYMMLGMINSKRSSQSWFLGKIKFGTQIKSYFLKAKELAPELPEVHLGLGTFYLVAPVFVGGNPEKAIDELELTVKLAPEFASANARLAQAYKRIGVTDKYEFYLARAKELDPGNAILKEAQNVKY
jgi:tetratricopeptide (TPR) repeat protein